MASRGSLVALVLGLVLLVVASASKPAEAAFPGENGRIAYSDGREIFSIGPDGSNPKQITQRPSSQGYDREPAYSPDPTGGTKIAFMRCERCQTVPTTEQGIWVKNVDTGEETRLSDGSDGYDDNYPAYSPDGSTIAFVRRPKGSSGDPGEIYTMRSDGTGVRRLTDNQYDDASPAWSPDGTKIAFESVFPDSDGGNTRGIALMNADGTGRKQLTDGGIKGWGDFRPSWSPDGTKIAFDRRGGNIRRLDVYTMNADGTEQRNVTNAAGDDLYPVWSPDGRKIAYLRDVANDNSGRYSILKMNTNGTRRQDITNGRFLVPGLNSGMDWRSRPTATLP